ncbi:MAG: segregation/condensation protein A [Fastidiosipila sp.]|nr:segregation/condensation protein A [Fastidiosipila sp.]
MTNEIAAKETRELEIQVDLFQSPLELLDHLLDTDKVALDELSIASITDQYLMIIKKMSFYDMDLVSSFLLMAATLIQIKSSLLLPMQKTKTESDSEFDPSSELIFQLLRYRRCRMIALQLKERHELYAMSYYKPEELPQHLGINKKIKRQKLNPDRFAEAVDAIVSRNSARFQSSKSTMDQILQREIISVNSCMDIVLDKLINKSQFFFYEVFTPDQSKETVIAGFLAILELLRRNLITVQQRTIFAPIYIEVKEK